MVACLWPLVLRWEAAVALLGTWTERRLSRSVMLAAVRCSLQMLLDCCYHWRCGC